MEASIRSRSLALTVFIHATLFLLLLFAVMHTYNPPFPESGGGGNGVLIDIGNEVAGMGAVQPLAPVVSNNPAPVKSVTTPPAHESKVATQENEESIAMKESKKKEPKKDETKAVKLVVAPIKEEKKPVVKPREADPGALYQGKSNNSKSQGTASSGTKDQGAEGGVPGGSEYNGKNGTGGTGPGTHGGPGGTDGPSIGDKNGNTPIYVLDGRTLLVRPTIEDRSQETGKVVVGITVNKEGNVTAAIPGVRGSTTTSAYLFNKAKEAAMKAKFSPDAKGNDIQKGTITFVFLVQ